MVTFLDREPAREIASFLAEGVYTLDINGILTFMNPEAEHLLGWRTDELAGKNIHDLIHNHQADGTLLPFEKCPMRNVLHSGRRYVSENDYFTRRDGTRFPVSVLSSPVWDGETVVAVVTAFRDITASKVAETTRQRMSAELEEKIRERTLELQKLSEELMVKNSNLEELNTALRVLLRQREQDKNEMEKLILANVKELVLPGVHHLKSFRINPVIDSLLSTLETNLRQILSPFSSQLTSKNHNLTQLELRIANFICEGKSSKEVAEIFRISKGTVDVHRKNIRKKLGLQKRKINLQSYLLSLR